MIFKRVNIGNKFFCPFCGSQHLDVADDRWSALCRECGRVFQVQLRALPDPNSKQAQRECHIKKCHTTLESALAHCDEIATKFLFGRPVKTLCIYRCRFDFCDSYHVGHAGKITKKGFNRELYMYRDLRPNIPEPEAHGIMETICEDDDYTFRGIANG